MLRCSSASSTGEFCGTEPPRRAQAVVNSQLPHPLRAKVVAASRLLRHPRHSRVQQVAQRHLPLHPHLVQPVAAKPLQKPLRLPNRLLPLSLPQRQHHVRPVAVSRLQLLHRCLVQVVARNHSLQPLPHLVRQVVVKQSLRRRLHVAVVTHNRSLSHPHLAKPVVVRQFSLLHRKLSFQPSRSHQLLALKAQQLCPLASNPVRHRQLNQPLLQKHHNLRRKHPRHLAKSQAKLSASLVLSPSRSNHQPLALASGF